MDWREKMDDIGFLIYFPQKNPPQIRSEFGLIYSFPVNHLRETTQGSNYKKTLPGRLRRVFLSKRNYFKKQKIRLWP